MNEVTTSNIQYIISIVAAIIIYSIIAIFLVCAIIELVKTGKETRVIEQEIIKGEKAYMLKLLTEKQIKSAEAVLSKGDRVELIPVKDGVRVIRVKREEIKNGSKM